jgi:putative colanic acid biosynthesis acetyltransferase WcaF
LSECHLQSVLRCIGWHFLVIIASTMQSPTTRLDLFSNPDYRPGSALKRVIWYLTECVFFKSAFPVSSFKRFLLRLFGAHIGQGVVIKPHVRIKYPWFLTVGDHTWIGENVWIDNLGQVDIGAHCCLSQGAMLLCGNHNYKKHTFDLIVGPITLENGVWIGAQSVVCPSVHCGSHAVLSVGSVAQKNLDPYTIYSGVPAQPIRKRDIF